MNVIAYWALGVAAGASFALVAVLQGWVDLGVCY